MDAPPTYLNMPAHVESSQSQALLVDMQWKKLQFLVKDANNPDATPLYSVRLQTVFAPHLKFKAIEGTEEREVGSGTIHTFGISPDYELHGRQSTLKAQKRFRTHYTHMSHVFADTKEPVQMTWTSNTDFKGWDFICVDDKQMPVAKFSANLWAVRKFGKIELLGPKAFDPAARDEIVVLAVTLFYCMYIRVNNPFNLLGSAFLSKEKTDQAQPQEELAGSSDIGEKQDVIEKQHIKAKHEIY
ncbi:hypothetical protein N7532_008604 [Penicillium argentinense]|uniref:Uncharacterized protein n=1 Tax=Penicillium argentinense TaxID=1131581 RepID=A0A9W9EXZ4_9EURO|nr:uncharacterized protein N7532_008604 [Penicillium argentinense]KAJ5089920.1 hypothetical protein N7532_008604 [Penicillium argentinense]